MFHGRGGLSISDPGRRRGGEPAGFSDLQSDIRASRRIPIYPARGARLLVPRVARGLRIAVPRFSPSPAAAASPAVGGCRPSQLARAQTKPASSRAASCPGVGQRRSTAFPTASILERNAASLLSVFTRSPDGLNILLTAPTQVGSPSPSSGRVRRGRCRRDRSWLGPPMTCGGPVLRLEPNPRRRRCGLRFIERGPSRSLHIF